MSARYPDRDLRNTTVAIRWPVWGFCKVRDRRVVQKERDRVDEESSGHFLREWWVL